MLSSILIVLFAAYVFQSIFAWFQLKRVYGTIETVRQKHKGKNCHLVTGSGRKKFLVIKKGVFMILVLDFDGRIIDYYDMEGYTVFTAPKQNPSYIGMTLDEVKATLTRKNQLTALEGAREQFGYLREAANAASQ